MVKLDRCDGSCDTLNDLSSKICVPNKTEDLNLIMLNIITETNKSKTSTKHKSYKCKCRFDGRKCNSDQWWNNDKHDVSVKYVMYVKKIMVRIHLHGIVKIGNI